MFDFIQRELAVRCSQSLLRELEAGQQGINFSSNDYLGLSQHQKLIQSWQSGAQQYGVGSGGSFLTTGYTRAHQELEEKLAHLTGYDSALLFNSGYSANQSVIKTLLRKDDLLLQDKLAHASLVEAGVLSPAQMKRYKHNDTEHLAALLQQDRPGVVNKLIVTEGVFSMDGDQAPLAATIKVAQQHGAWIMLDDAHGFGVLADGSGSLIAQELCAKDINIYMATFGKALGVSGAFVAADREVTDYLINFSKTYIYSTAMPAAMAFCINRALDIISEEKWRFRQLDTVISYFKQRCETLGFSLLPSDTPIQPLLIGDAAEAVKVSQYLGSQGILVKAIRPPTVPQGTSRLRITLTALHSYDDVDRLLQALQEILDV